jgi:hypothetical protein
MKKGPQPVSTSPDGELILKEPLMDKMDRNRHIFTKGRWEFMGGPVMYTQGHGIPGYDNNERKPGYSPMNANADPISFDLNVDTTEQ